MSDASDELRASVARYAGRILQTRLVLAAAAVVLAVFVLSGALSVLQAVVGFGVIAAAALVGFARRNNGGTPVSPAARSAVPGDPMLEAVISGIPDPVVALDREGRVLAFNAQAHLLAPALRRSDPALIALRMPELVEAIRQATASGDVQRIEFSERVPADRWYEAVVTPVLQEGGPVEGPLEFVLVTFRDLTPLRRVEEMRADFVANASHELRTPLAALSGFIETLQGSARDDRSAHERFLPIMQAQARRMARLIDDLLSLSRIELNEHRHPATAVDVVPLVRQVVDGLQTLARDREVTIRIKAPPQSLMVLGDRDELIRVFENLVENALKYGASGKRVDIDVAAADAAPELTVAVRDYGPGIAPEHLPRLTERFYRVNVADSRSQGGTGLGLALAKHILNRHRGRLAIASTLGQGATFTAHIPLLAAESSGAPKSSAGSKR